MFVRLKRFVPIIALSWLLTACPQLTAPAELSVTPSSLTLNTGDNPVNLNAALKNSSATITWSLAGEGNLTATTGAVVQYVPPSALDDQKTATIVVSAGALARTITVTIKPRPNLFVSPENPTLSAGGAAFEFTARLDHATGEINWTLSGPGALSATTGSSVRYTPPATLSDATAATLTATASGLSVSVTIALAPSQTGIVLNPLAATLTAGDAPVNFNAALTNSGDTISWTLSGPGVIDVTTGSSVRYTPPATLDTEQTATLTASGAGLSRSAQITIKPRSKLTVAITSPTGTVYSRDAVTVQVNVSGGAPETVELLRDGNPLATLVPPYQYTWNVTNEPEGAYHLSARAKRGTERFDSSANLTVNVDRTPPAIAARTPAPNATDVARNAPITIGFSESLEPSSVNDASLTLTQNGSPATRTVQLSSDGRTITVTPATNPEPTTVYAISLTNLRDRAGNTVSAAWTWTVPDWLEFGYLGQGEHFGCSQLKLDFKDRPVVYCVNLIGGYVYGSVQRLTNGAWESLGGGAFNTETTQSVLAAKFALRADGTPVVASIETTGTTNVVYVKELRAGTWVSLGGPLNIDLSRQLDTSSLDISLDTNGLPIVAFIEASKMYVRRFQSGSWMTLGGDAVPNASPTGYSAPASPKILILADGSVHAFWQTFESAYVTNIFHQKWSGSWATEIGFGSYSIFNYEPFFYSSGILLLKLGSGRSGYYGTNVGVEKLNGLGGQYFSISSSGRSAGLSSNAVISTDGVLYTAYLQSQSGYPGFQGYDVFVSALTSDVSKSVGTSLESNATTPVDYAPTKLYIALDSTNTPVVAIVGSARLILKRYNR